MEFVRQSKLIFASRLPTARLNHYNPQQQHVQQPAPKETARRSIRSFFENLSRDPRSQSRRFTKSQCFAR